MEQERSGAREAVVSSAAPPHRVRVPVNVHRWERIAFLHWRYDPALVAALLPSGLTVATSGGAAWVGVTPFVMRVRPPGLPVTPPGCTFPETNLRTYVIGPDGRQGLWFLRLEAGAAWFVAALRTLGLPYVHQRMAVVTDGDRVTYRSRALAAGGGGGHTIEVRFGDGIDAGPLDRFLTARWRAYHSRGTHLLATPVDHQPWPLRRAEALVADVDPLLRAGGLPSPEAAPVVHASDGVTVRVGVPRRVGSRGARRG